MAKNVASSIKARLLQAAREQGDEFNFLFIRYVQERMLYRLSQSKHADDFILKGALLFLSWRGSMHRPTKDIDFLGSGESSLQRMRDMFVEIAKTDVEPDGLVFDPEGVFAEPIREDEEYGGVRVYIEARLGTAEQRIQIDIGFGDAVSPSPMRIQFPTVLALPAPTLRAYPRETVIAEKLEAMVKLGMANSRMKDFFDIDHLALNFEFDMNTLRAAIASTFTRRSTPLPIAPPVALTESFATDASKVTQWRSFLKRSKLDSTLQLNTVVSRLAAFLGPPLLDTSVDATWSAASGWRSPARG